MAQREKMAWWTLLTGLLIWVYLLMRFTEDWRIVDLSARAALSAYVQMVLLWIAASAIPAVVASRHADTTPGDERDLAIEARGERWEGWVVVIAVNVLIVHLLSDALYPDRVPSLPRLALDSMPALVFWLLTVLFLGDAAKQAAIIWQYRR